jgi:hypothetical protein
VNVRLSTSNITGKKDNLPLKYASWVQFYKFLIQNKFKHYTKFDRVKIIRQYHYVLKSSKKLDVSDWIFLIKNYLKNINSAVIIGFIKKYV